MHGSGQVRKGIKDYRDPLIVRLGRLPDINDEKQLADLDYTAYGRFALTRNNCLVLSGIRSSHPANTRVGWYWAVDIPGNLIVSPRGAMTDIEVLLADDGHLLKCLIKDLVDSRLLSSVSGYRIER